MSRSERKELVSDLHSELSVQGYDLRLSKDQARRIYRGDPLEEVLDGDQLHAWETRTDEIPF